MCGIKACFDVQQSKHCYVATYHQRSNIYVADENMISNRQIVCKLLQQIVGYLLFIYVWYVNNPKGAVFFIVWGALAVESFNHCLRLLLSRRGERDLERSRDLEYVQNF